MKVLIVKVSALGDVVHALPVLAYLKSADPDMQIDWLVEQAFAPFLEIILSSTTSIESISKPGENPGCKLLLMTSSELSGKSGRRDMIMCSICRGMPRAVCSR